MPEDPARAEELRIPLTHERKEKQEDDYTQEEPDWKPKGTILAKVEALSGGERIDVNGQRQITRYRVTIRYRRDIKATDRFLWDDFGHLRTLYVQSTKNWMQRNRWLIIDTSSAEEQSEFQEA